MLTVVLVPTLTFIAAVNPVRYQYAEPVFLDCDDSLCIDPKKFQKFCEDECSFQKNTLYYQNKPVKAIVVVHVFGNLADMESIMEIAEQYHLKVIEDATEALGTKYLTGLFKGKYAGTIGDYGAFSFNANKIITTGGEGAVTAKNVEAVNHIKYLSTQAKDEPHYYIHDEIGYNYRMTNVQAAIGIAQMEELPEFIRRKKKNYELYKELLSDFAFVSLMQFREGTESIHWFYALMLNREKLMTDLHEIIMELDKRGIQTRPIWGLIHEQKPYQSFNAYRIEKAKEYRDCIINIPCGTNLTENEVRYTVKEIRGTLQEPVV